METYLLPPFPLPLPLLPRLLRHPRHLHRHRLLVQSLHTWTQRYISHGTTSLQAEICPLPRRPGEPLVTRIATSACQMDLQSLATSATTTADD